MVATTLSTDTPNLVTDIVRKDGVAGNWVWWAFLLTGMLTVFTYARLWRRSEVLFSSLGGLKGVLLTDFILFIIAMVVSFIMAVVFQLADIGLESWQRLVIGVGITTAAWLSAALLTVPADRETLKSFCRKINPGGPGWRPVYEAIRAEGGQVEGDAVNLPRGILCMLLGCAMVYSALFATGVWIYGQIPSAFILSVVALIAVFALLKLWGRK